ncbi:MAG: hypothetical protein AAFW47_03040 [Pseudomonadota bacterium]
MFETLDQKIFTLFFAVLTLSYAWFCIALSIAVAHRKALRVRAEQRSTNVHIANAILDRVDLRAHGLAILLFRDPWPLYGIAAKARQRHRIA